MKVKVLLILALCLLLVTPTLAQSETTVYATAQRFERGLMIWRADTGQIWALSNDGLAFSFPSSSYLNLPDNPIFGNPPSRLRPIMGFGKVWGNHAELRNRLGWPTLPEIGFDMPVRVENNTHFLTQLDGTTIQINPDLTWHSYIMPTVLSVGYSPKPIQPGASMEIFWTVRGTDVALVEVYDLATGELLTLMENLPLTGSAPYDIPTTATGGLNIVVWGANRPDFYTPVTMWERVVQSSIPAHTEDSAVEITTQAAFQQYENGFMIWQADTGEINVFFGANGGIMGGYPQEIYEPYPDNPFHDVPDGFIRPISGFGRLWGSYPGIKDTLGWATAPEQSYQLTIQERGLSTWFSLPDGRIAKAHRMWWNF